MERLFFVPLRRSPLRDGLGDHVVRGTQELRLDGNLEDVSASFSWEVFYDFLGDWEGSVPKLLWLADGVFVVHYAYSLSLMLIPVARRFGFTCWMRMCDVCVFVRHGMNPVPVYSALIDWRCNAETDGAVSIGYMWDTIDGDDAEPIALPLTTEALVRLLGSRNVRSVYSFFFAFNGEQSRALATAATLDRLELMSCAVQDQFWEALHLNRSPRELVIASVLDESVFAAALRENTSIKSLVYHIIGPEEGTAEVIESFAHNHGIVDLCLVGIVDDDIWSLLSQALARNGTVTSLDLSALDRAGFCSLSRESCTMRTRAIGDILEHNTLIQQIHLNLPGSEMYRDEDLYQSLVVPRLELNQFRPHVRSVQEAPDDERGNTFLNACLRAGDNLSMVYLLLRENTDFVVETVSP